MATHVIACDYAAITRILIRYAAPSYTQFTVLGDRYLLGTNPKPQSLP